MPYLPEPPLLSELRATLAENPPFCSGVLTLASDELEMYFGRHNAQYVSLVVSRFPLLTSIHIQIHRLCEIRGDARRDGSSRSRMRARRVWEGPRDDHR